MYTNFFPKLYGVMPKELSVFSLRKKTFEESVRNLMKYFSSYDILFVRTVYRYLRWPRLREQIFTAPGDPLAYHNKLPSLFPLYLRFHARTIRFLLCLTLRNMVLTVLS